jgi:hypothetical protein
MFTIQVAMAIRLVALAAASEHISASFTASGM